MPVTLHEDERNPRGYFGPDQFSKQSAFALFSSQDSGYLRTLNIAMRWSDKSRLVSASVGPLLRKANLNCPETENEVHEM